MHNTQLQLLIMGQDKQPKAASSDRKTILERTIEEGNQFYTTASRIIRRISTAQRLKLKNKKLKGEKEKKKKKSKIISKQNEKRKKDEKKIQKVKEHKTEQRRKSYNEMKFSNKKDDFKQLNGSVGAGKELNSRMWIQKQNPFPNIRPNSCKINICNIGKTATLSKCRSDSPQNPKFQVVDVCFCIEATGSMTAQIYELQNVIAQVVKTIQNIFFTQGISLRFAVVSYRDHNPQDQKDVTKFLNFTDQQEAINYLKALQAFGGGDQPKAVHDGLLESVKSLNWGELPGVPVLRYIIHIADAQPHGKQFGNDEAQNGCTCGIQTEHVIKQINKHNIQYALMKVRNNNRLDQMQKIFKEKLGHFTSFSIKNPKQLEKCVSNLIKMDMLPN